MYHWAHGALIRTCNFLNEWFGGTSCQLKTGRSRGMFHTPEEVSILFDPRLGGDDAKCSCEGVDRWVLAAGYAFALGYKAWTGGCLLRDMPLL